MYYLIISTWGTPLNICFSIRVMTMNFIPLFNIFILLSFVKDSFICHNNSKITFFPLSTLRCLSIDIWHSFWQDFQFTVCNIYFFHWIHSWYSLYVWFSAAGKLCGHVFVCFIIWILTTFPTWGFLSFFDLCFLKFFINVRNFLYTVSFSISYYSFTFLFR